MTIDASTAIRLFPGEHHSIRKAAEILAGDIERITGSAPAIGDWQAGEAAGGRIVLLSLDNPAAAAYRHSLSLDWERIEGHWEAYVHAAQDGDLIVCGANAQGTLRGAYAVGRERLGVDPWIRWTEIQPARQEAVVLDLAEPIYVASPTFRFRGWFLNNAHLIKWNMGEGIIRDFKMRHGRVDSDLSGAFGRETATMVAESCLRQEMNFVVPLSAWEIDDPDARAVAEVCLEYGLYISFHHLEPVGANLRDWEPFWQARGEVVPAMSFGKHPEKFEEWWRYFITEWSGYERVIWTIGHRGPGDRRYWLADPHDPGNNPDRGRTIAAAMDMQLRLIREVMGDEREVHYCAVLWQDGSELHAENLLEFPPGTMVVMADNGGKQMMREDFYQTPRRDNVEYGVYYHACYGPGGPHWAQATNPAKMWNNIKQVIDKQETSIALLNTGSIRTYVMGIEAFSRMTTRGGTGFEPECFVRDWCRRYFGDQADAATEAHMTYAYATIAPWQPGYDGARGLWDTLHQIEIHNILKWIYHRDIDAAFARKPRTMQTADEFLLMHRHACAAGIPIWDKICSDAHAIERQLTGKRLDFWIGGFLCHAELMRGLFHCGYHTARSAFAMQAGDDGTCRAELRTARAAVEVGLVYWAENGNRPPFRNWISGPDRIRGYDESTLDMFDGVLLSLESATLPADTRARLDQQFFLKTPEPHK